MMGNPLVTKNDDFAKSRAPNFLKYYHNMLFLDNITGINSGCHTKRVLLYGHINMVLIWSKR